MHSKLANMGVQVHIWWKVILRRQTWICVHVQIFPSVEQGSTLLPISICTWVLTGARKRLDALPVLHNTILYMLIPSRPFALFVFIKQ